MMSFLRPREEASMQESAQAPDQQVLGAVADREQA